MTSSFVQDVDHYLNYYMGQRAVDVQGYSPSLVEAMMYSLMNGGKRFRPTLCLRAAQVLEVPTERALPFAAALEMVHTYSLVHDDLPCMDNDDERRGKPTNHKVYGEPLALLAGDALLTESFLLISEAYKGQPAYVADLVRVLSRAAGASGMVGGQAVDMGLGIPLVSERAVLNCHRGKTAALIAAAFEGAGVLAALPQEQMQCFKFVGECLGLAFQIKDDLLDAEKTPKSILYYWDAERVHSYLKELESEGENRLKTLPLKSQELLSYFKYNYERTH